ncbi:MAG: hypothetical protein P8M11_15500 [Planctomycetota bacterium]|nr:hypothetical protein [Planctomycetota bacterium]
MTPFLTNSRAIAGDFVTSDAAGTKGADSGFRWARIRCVDRMAPFLTTLASGSDHWGFISSRGALTAGRRNVDQALFPYRTVDRVHDAEGSVGGSTIIRLSDGTIWEPFTQRGAGAFDVSQDLERCILGSALALIEHNHTLGLSVRQCWTSSEEHGIVRTVRVANTGETSRSLEVLDGVLDVMPPAIEKSMMDAYSILVDAYRFSELADGVALFGLGSIPVDRAEPSESLASTSAWCSAPGTRLLSTQQQASFRRGDALEEENLVRGKRSAFLIEQSLELAPGANTSWVMTLEVDRSADDVEGLLAWQLEAAAPAQEVLDGVSKSRETLLELLADADGLQCTASDAEDARHAANTLYNTMRGGLFPLGTRQPRAAFIDHLSAVAPAVFAAHADRIAGWPDEWIVGELLEDAAVDPDLERHLREFLPLAFSRRHGDPSRPWNTFSIDVRGEQGELTFGYQGNWRDIFQNWEALGLANPTYLEAFIVRFLNASTADGYNPYRITSEGLDWEVYDPNNPWSYIGYWGDHQIVYLTRLIERLEEHYPGRMAGLLGRAIFVHADVPYRIRGFDDLVRNPQTTVDYDNDRAWVAGERVDLEGADGKLVHDSDGGLVRATLEEKLLVPFLAKLSNLVPGAGIWMNAQRPEWNDANNALVGSGASVVTTCAMFRHTEVLATVFEAAQSLSLSSRTRQFLDDIVAALEAGDATLATSDPAARWSTTEALGRAGERHRAAVYGDTEDGLEAADVATLRRLFAAATEWLKATADANVREDGLFHGYDLVAFGDAEVRIRHLPLMLEGQVAALSAGIVRGAEAVGLLDALRASPLHREDLDTYLLYPDRELPGLLDKGVLNEGAEERVPVIKLLLEAGDRSVIRPGAECLRFAPSLQSAAALSTALDSLVEGPLGASVERDRAALLDEYEAVFDHAAFTGRSGTFFGYEGLGCTFWHMASKLILSIQETLWCARDQGEPAEVCAALRRHYRAARAGLGTHKSPEEFGAFPTEPYSHSQADGGARQPGMSGQVKEDLLSRVGEVGLRIRDGRIQFDGALLHTPELRDDDGVLRSPSGELVEVPAGALAVSHCGVPFVIRRGAAAKVELIAADGTRTSHDAGSLDADTSRGIWGRSGAVQRVEVTLPTPESD